MVVVMFQLGACASGDTMAAEERSAFCEAESFGYESVSNEMVCLLPRRRGRG